MRRLWGLIILTATALSATFLPQVLASLSTLVKLPAANPAKYRTVSTNSWFIKCQVPKTIVLQKAKSRPGSYFSCDNHFNTGITLTWSVQDDGNGGAFLTIPAGQSTLLTANSTGCRTLTLNSGNLALTSQPVTFKGATTTASGLYVEIYFTALVTVQNGAGGVGNSCP